MDYSDYEVAPMTPIGDHEWIASDLAARGDLYAAAITTDQISANRLTLMSLADQLAKITAFPALAMPSAVAGSKKRKKPLFRIQPGWRWDNHPQQPNSAP